MNASIRWAAVCAVLACSGMAARAQKMPADYQQFMTYLGRPGDYSDNVLRINVPRNDLNVSIAGIPVPTAFGLSGWVAITPASGGRSMLMGDLPLLQDEVNWVMSEALSNGLEVTGIHNHFFWDEPHVYFMHIEGMGSPSELARRVKPALEMIGHIPGASQPATTTGSSASGPTNVSVEETGFSIGALNTARISEILGRVGQLNGDVYKVTVGRPDLRVRDMGATLNSRMGINTWASFVGTDANAMTIGDFVMTDSEVTPVVKALRNHDLRVVAIHNHMLGATPRLTYLHFWGKGPADQLATGLRAALDELGRHGRDAMSMK